MPTSLPDETNGPDQWHGGPSCPDHHDGLRTGITDWCCCCHPCYYEKPQDVAVFSCRCVPQLLCIIFTPDDGQDPCCVPIHGMVQPSYNPSSPASISYIFVMGIDIEWRIQSGEWRLYVDSVLQTSVAIDHTTSTCLDVPAYEITGFTYGPCIGSLTFSVANIAKLPFQNRQLLAVDDFALVDGNFLGGAPNCTHAAAILCVSGKRHAGDTVDEYVEFGWNEALGDRWSYLPPGGDVTTDQEHIYLRRDSDGNPYLEFDFEQSGTDTNDWADPPNTFDILDPWDIRDGMLAINSCVCGMRAQTTSTGGRSIIIHAGYCGHWKYHCAACRCTPRYICIIGTVNYVGDNIQRTGVWDGTGWTVDDGYGGEEFRINLTEDDEGSCVLTTPNADLASAPVSDCGYYLSAELDVPSDEYASGNEWLWVSALPCGECGVFTCGDCLGERCGGPPTTLYFQLEAEDLGPDDPLDPDFGTITHCDLTVVGQYYVRWDPTTRGALECGYIGFSDPITCDGETFRVRVTMNALTKDIEVTRVYLPGSSGPAATFGDNYLFSIAQECDPYYLEGDWTGVGGVCIWGCLASGLNADIVRVIVYE